MEFRFKALRHAHDPDDLDTPVNLADPKAWIAVFVTMVLLAGALLWAFLGRLPQTVSGPGVLGRAGGVLRVQLPYESVVGHTDVVAGTHVAAGDRLVEVTDVSGTAHRVPAPRAGTVMSADQGDGTVVDAGRTLVTLETDATAGPPLSAMVVVPVALAAALAPGTDARLTVDGVPAKAFGLLRGSVTSVSTYPATADGLQSAVYDLDAVQRWTSGGPVALVTVTLRADPATRSGYAWTSAAGPPFPLAFQAGVTAEFDLGSKRPIDYVFGA